MLFSKLICFWTNIGEPDGKLTWQYWRRIHLKVMATYPSYNDLTTNLNDTEPQILTIFNVMMKSTPI